MYYFSLLVRTKEKDTVTIRRGDSAFHLGADFDGVVDGVADNVLLGERACERVCTLSCSSSTASCDCAGVLAITSRGGISLLSSCCIIVFACTSASGAGLPAAELDVGAPPRSNSSAELLSNQYHRGHAGRGCYSRAPPRLDAALGPPR